MASFVKVDKGKFRAFVFVEKRGKRSRITKTFNSKKEAQDWAFALEIAKNSGQDLLARDSRFADLYTWWVRNVKKQDVKESTFIHYREYGKRVETMFGSYKLKDLSAVLVQQLMDDYGKDHSQKTVHEFLVVIKACIRYCVAVGFIPLDWTKLVKPHGRQTSKRNLALSITDMTRLRQHCLKHLENEFNVFILLVLESGLRRGEVLGLCPEDLIAENGEFIIQVRRSKSPHVKSLSLKTAKARREVSISQRVFEAVRSIHVKDDGFVFSEDGFHQSEMLKQFWKNLRFLTRQFTVLETPTHLICFHKVLIF